MSSSEEPKYLTISVIECTDYIDPEDKFTIANRTDISVIECTDQQL